MSRRSYYGPSSRSSSHVPGVGAVPTGPSQSPSSSITNQYSRHQHESPYNHKHSPNTRAQGGNDARTWDAWDSLGSHNWHEANVRNQGRYASRNRERDEYRFSSHSRSRSRSPERVTFNNGNVFSRRGHIFARPNENSYQRQDSAHLEIPPYIAGEPRPPNDCECAISWHCRHRPGEIPDCRPLVPRQKAWAAGQKQQVEVVELTARGLITEDLRNVIKLNQLARVLSQLSYGARPRNQRVFDQLRYWITEVQEYAFIPTCETLETSRALITLKEFLSEENQDLRMAARFPVDIEEDLESIKRKWMKGDLNNHPDRGLVRDTNRSGTIVFRIDKTWTYYQSANYFGAGNLVNGQRWKLRVYMLRDGVHGALVAGIWGHSVQEGCQALVMGLHGQDNGGYYADRDMGDIVWYITTARRAKDQLKSSDEEDEDADVGPTNYTKMLLRSIETQKPIRLIRSHKLAGINKFRPAQGYRYDGLYVAVGSELLDKERHIYRVKLERLPGQGPIRVNDHRTFDETPEEIARAAKQKESARRYREGARTYR